jgi:hypothetical protein
MLSNFFYLFICAYIVWTISPSYPLSHPLPLLPTPLSSRHNMFFPLLQLCWREDISNNKKDVYYTCTCVLHMHMCITSQTDSSLPDLFTTSQSPSHSDLCSFKVTLLTPLQWAHQTILSFRFLTSPYFSCMCSPLRVWPKSNNITAFVLGLNSSYEGEHMIFGLLSLANLA